ncbi:hypothetical protein D9M71_277740 [compost metagenome]
MGCQQHGLVAGDVGLRRQHVQALRPRGSRRGFQGEGGNTAFGHLADQFTVEGVEHAHQKAAAVDQGQFLVVGGDHFEYQLGAVGIGGASKGSTHGFIGTVRNGGVEPCPPLNGDLMALANQFLDGFGGRSDPCLTGLRLERNTNVHDYFSCGDLLSL